MAEKLGLLNQRLFGDWDLEDSGRTRKLADSELPALRTVADWIKTFVAKPNKNLGRSGPICPFVSGALALGFDTSSTMKPPAVLTSLTTASTRDGAAGSRHRKSS